MGRTRDRIIGATNELFRATGCHGTSSSSISGAADAPVGSIYHFFPGGKDELVVAVIESTGTACRKPVRGDRGYSRRARRRVRRLLRGSGRRAEENDHLDPCQIGTIARETASTNDSIPAAARNAFESRLTAASDRLVAAGVDDRRARDLAVAFVAAIDGGFVLSRTLRGGEPLRATGRSLAPLIDAAVGAAR